MATGDICSGFGLEAIGEGEIVEVVLPAASFFFARISAREGPLAGAAVIGLDVVDGADAVFPIEGAGGAEERPFAVCGAVGTGDAVPVVRFEVEAFGGTEALPWAGCGTEGTGDTPTGPASTPLPVPEPGSFVVVGGADADSGRTSLKGEAIGWLNAAVERVCCFFRPRSYSSRSVMKISTVFFFGFLTFGFAGAGPDADADVWSWDCASVGECDGGAKLGTEAGGMGRACMVPGVDEACTAEGGAETELGRRNGGESCCEPLIERPGMRSLSPLDPEASFVVEEGVKEFIARISEDWDAGGPISLCNVVVNG